MRIGAGLRRLLGRKPTVLQASPDDILCNHYKFKSRAEWAARAARQDTGTYVAGRFSRDSNVKWERDSDVRERAEILRFVEPVRRALAEPVPPAPATRPHFCAAVALFRDEEDYIDEWLAYHTLQGVDHFYLYHNGDDLSGYRKLHDYVAAGRVTLHDWPDGVAEAPPPELRRKTAAASEPPSIQQLAVLHCCTAYRHETEWLATIDIDEYLVPLVAPDLKTQLQRWRRHKGVVVPRITFSSMGYEEKPEGLIIESYLRSSAGPENFKSIAQTRWLSRHQTGGPHYFKYRKSDRPAKPAG